MNGMQQLPVQRELDVGGKEFSVSDRLLFLGVSGGPRFIAFVDSSYSVVSG